MTTRDEAIKAVSGAFATKQNAIEWQTAMLGDGHGTVSTGDNTVYCRLTTNSSVVEVLNYRVAPVDGLLVRIAKTPEMPLHWQVIGQADQRADEGSTTVTGGIIYNTPPHQKTHAYLGVDQVNVDWRQITTLRVYAYSGFVVGVLAGLLPRPGADLVVPTQTLDLSASVPAGGARYTLISVNSAGALVATDGTAATGLLTLTLGDIPDTPAGNFRLAAVRLYAGQAAISESTTSNDIRDLRWPQERLATSISPADITLANQHFIVGNASGVGSDAGTGVTYNPTPRTLSVDNVQFDLTPTPAAPAEGLMYWNVDDGTLNLGMPGGSVNLQIGQEMLLRAKNTTGADITNGQLVYISSGTGSNAIISLAKADAEATSATTIGMATELIANNQFGYVTLIGMVRDVNTIAYTAGTALYLSAATAGAYTSTKPDAPNHLVTIGVVIRQHATEGVIFVRIDNGYELSELHDVYISSIADGDILRYVGANSRWENKTLASAGIITGTPGTLTVSSINAAADPHTHAITSSSNPGANARILASDASGYLQLTRIGIGTAATASNSIESSHTYTATSGNVGGLNAIVTTSPSATSTISTRGALVRVFTSTGNAHGTVTGVACQVQIGSTATISNVCSGGQFYAYKTGASGGIADLYGGEFYAATLAGSGGTITRARGGSFGVFGSTGTVTIGSAYGVYVLPATVGSGAITNLYGLYVADQNVGGTLNYAIYTNAGLVRLGDVTSINVNNATTSAADTVLTLAHNSTGTAAASFGLRTNYTLESATTADQVAGYEDILWTDATHASRTALLRGTTTGNAVNTGFYGAWAHNAIAATAITIIPNGTGDVASVGSFVFTVKDNTSATTNGGVVVLNPGGGAISLLSDGTDTLQITCAADGSVTIARSAGTHTFAVSLWGTWQ